MIKIVTELIKAKDVIKYEPFGGIDGYFDYQTYQLKSNKNVNFDVSGVGLYGILYKDRLIYIGKFQGKNMILANDRYRIHSRRTINVS